MMTRKFIPWFGTYAAGVAGILWLGRALFYQWPTVGALMITIGILLWSNVAFRYAFLMGVHATRVALGMPAAQSKLIALWHRDENPLV